MAINNYQPGLVMAVPPSRRSNHHLCQFDAVERVCDKRKTAVDAPSCITRFTQCMQQHGSAQEATRSGIPNKLTIRVRLMHIDRKTRSSVLEPESFSNGPTKTSASRMSGSNLRQSDHSCQIPEPPKHLAACKQIVGRQGRGAGIGAERKHSLGRMSTPRQRRS